MAGRHLLHLGFLDHVIVFWSTIRSTKKIQDPGRTDRKTQQLKLGNGAPGKIRTPDPLIRSQVLYPAELPVRTPPKRKNVILACRQ